MRQLQCQEPGQRLPPVFARVRLRAHFCRGGATFATRVPPWGSARIKFGETIHHWWASLGGGVPPVLPQASAPAQRGSRHRTGG